MTAVAEAHLIRPHGGELVDRTGERPGDVESFEVVRLTSREVSDLDMLASGALSPLIGFMGSGERACHLDRKIDRFTDLDSPTQQTLTQCLALDQFTGDIVG